mmetsp:Transcript_121593/g.343984  ORF Transcript_121593/g.343984 Transcript_121593/m.343984 type:complete len:237 (-) Transcript_121593:1400-2110(-)
MRDATQQFTSGGANSMRRSDMSIVTAESRLLAFSKKRSRASADHRMKVLMSSANCGLVDCFNLAMRARPRSASWPPSSRLMRPSRRCNKSATCSTGNAGRRDSTSLPTSSSSTGLCAACTRCSNASNPVGSNALRCSEAGTPAPVNATGAAAAAAAAATEAAAAAAFSATEAAAAARAAAWPESFDGPAGCATLDCLVASTFPRSVSNIFWTESLSFRAVCGTCALKRMYAAAADS